MPTKMQMANLEFISADHPDAQKIAVLNHPKGISVAYAKITEPGPDEVRVKIKWVGICGSDLEVYRGTRRPEFLSTPVRLGHEVAGTINKAGVNVNGIKPGDLVTCRYVWGAFAQYIVCKPMNVKVMPPDFPVEGTSLIEILPGVIHTAELAKVESGKTNVLITGQGVSGLVLTQVLSLYSPRSLVVTDFKNHKLELVHKYGATHTYQIPSTETPTMEMIGEDFPDGFEVVIPCLFEGYG